jgi:hypothetical protein
VQASTALDRRWYELWTSPSPLLFSAGDLAAASRYRVKATVGAGVLSIPQIAQEEEPGAP